MTKKSIEFPREGNDSSLAEKGYLYGKEDEADVPLLNDESDDDQSIVKSASSDDPPPYSRDAASLPSVRQAVTAIALLIALALLVLPRHHHSGQNAIELPHDQAPEPCPEWPGIAPEEKEHKDWPPWKHHEWQKHPWQQHPWQKHPWQQHPWQKHPWQQHPWQKHPWQQHKWQKHPWQHCPGQKRPQDPCP